MPFTTWDPTNLSAITLSGGNLTAASASGLARGVSAVQPQLAGKYYHEITLTTFSLFSNFLGIANPTVNVATVVGTYVPTVAINQGGGTISVNNVSTGISLGALAAGDIMCVATDLDLKRIWFRRGIAGNWNNNATYNPATNVGGVDFTVIMPIAFGCYPVLSFNGGGQSVTANFGATAFAGTAPAGFVGWPDTSIARSVVGTQIGVETWASGTPDVQFTQIGVEAWAQITPPNVIATQVGIEAWMSVAAAPQGGPIISLIM